MYSEGDGMTTYHLAESRLHANPGSGDHQEFLGNLLKLNVVAFEDDDYEKHLD